jgi:hypothetical protein
MADWKKIGRNSKQKGKREELLAEEVLKENGFTVRKGIKKKGTTGHHSDRRLSLSCGQLKLEIKSRKTGFSLLYKALEQDNCPLLMVRQVSKTEKKNPWLIVMEVDTLSKIVRGL